MPYADIHCLLERQLRIDKERQLRADNADPDSLRMKIAQGAVVHLRARLATSARPFLRDRQDFDLITRKAWKDSCIEYSSTALRSCVSLEPNEEELYALGLKVFDLYQELEELARQLVVKHYGFKDPKLETSPERATEVISSNQNLFYKFNLGRNFLHRGDVKQSSQPRHMYHHAILQEYICRAWFEDGHKSPGLRAEERFNKGGLGIPLLTIAFVIAAISYALKEWQTGTCEKTPFSFRGAHTQATYYNSLSHITLWEAYTVSISQNYGIFRRLLFVNAR